MLQAMIVNEYKSIIFEERNFFGCKR